jgi:hypothetical protein
VDTLYPASGALSTFLLSGFIPSNCVPLSLTFYSLRRYRFNLRSMPLVPAVVSPST